MRGNMQLFGLCTVPLDSAFLRRQRRTQTRGGHSEPRAYPLVASSPSGSAAGIKLHLTLRYRSAPSAHSSLPSRSLRGLGAPSNPGGGSTSETSSTDAAANVFGVPLDALTKYVLRSHTYSYLINVLVRAALLNYEYIVH